jgi:hypothetical protein
MGDITDLFKRPLYAGIAGLVAGLLLGLIFAWGIWPVEWKDAPVDLLRGELQEEYLRMAIDSYAVNRDETMAESRYQQLGANRYDTFQNVRNAPGKLDPNAILAYEQVLQKKGIYNPQGVTPAQAQTPASTFATVAAIFGGLLAIGLVAAVAFWLFRRPRQTGDLTPAQQAREHVRAMEKTDYTTTGQEPPIAQYVTSYVLGDDLFDDSFSIDAPSGEFLGECGVGISETIGVGDPKKVTAFEVWMFDKNDIQTVTKVLMSAHAFRDPAYRAKLEAKGELFEIAPQRQVVLETQTLQMVATVADMQYGDGPLPEGSYCDRLTLELAIWKK